MTFLKPGDDDGHPGYSTLAAFEQFVTHAVDEVQNNPTLWKQHGDLRHLRRGRRLLRLRTTIQPVSFFGDGTRVPMVVVSPYAKPGYISHTYTDHVSTPEVHRAQLEAPAAVGRSLDNLPEPDRPIRWLPTFRHGQPAIGDMFDFFDFHNAQAAASAGAGAEAARRRTHRLQAIAHPELAALAATCCATAGLDLWGRSLARKGRPAELHPVRPR